MREVSNGMMFKQFMGVPLLDYFTETSPCHCTWNKFILTQLVQIALRFCLCSLSRTASASLFHQSSFCHTLRECYKHNVPSPAYFFSPKEFCFAVGPNLVTIPDVRVLRFSRRCSWGFRLSGKWHCALRDADVSRRRCVRFFLTFRPLKTRTSCCLKTSGYDYLWCSVISQKKGILNPGTSELS